MRAAIKAKSGWLKSRASVSTGRGVLVEDLAQAQARIHMLVGGEAAAPRQVAGKGADRPAAPAVEAARLKIDEGLGGIAGVEAPFGQMRPDGEAEHELIAPAPHAVIRRPAGEAAGLPVDLDLLQTLPLLERLHLSLSKL